MNGSIQAICTAPLNKEALHAGGHLFPGHTELLASLTGAGEVSMMLSTPKLRVVHVTTHIGLLDAIEKIDAGLVERTITRAHTALQRSGFKIHASACAASILMLVKTASSVRGEELEKIVPAVEACVSQRMERQRSSTGRHAVLPCPAR